MSLTYGFYNSLNHDRKYDSLQISRIFDGIINDGVYQSIGDAMIVKTSNGMTVSVGLGRAWFNHTWTLNDALYLVTIADAELALNRYDAVILEINSDNSVRANSIKVIKGTPAVSPVKPTLTKSDTVNQYPLAYIYVGAKVTEITQANIQNTVGTSECPFVTGVMESISADDLIQQWSSEFDVLFAGLEEKISQAASQTLIDGSVTRQKVAANAISDLYTVTIGTDWLGDIAPYSIAVTINGVTSDDSPEIDLKPSSDYEVASKQVDAWGAVYRAVSGTNSITFYATEKPEVQIPIQVRCIRR